MNNISDVKMQNGIQVAVSNNGFQISVNVKCLMFKLNVEVGNEINQLNLWI